VKSQPFGPLEPALYREIIRRALAEDLGWGDLSTEGTVTPEQRAVGTFIAKAPCVVAGLDVALEAFRQLDPTITIEIRRADSAPCAAGDVIAEVQGLATAMLTAERTALNFLQRLSGIATQTRRFVDAAKGQIRILDTRKTTPTLRALEKYAVRAGGGTNHRMGLDDGILIKDNHIRLAGGISEALARMRTAQHEMPIEIEVQSFDQLEQALQAGATRILADNFTVDELKEVVQRTRGRAQIEISGGVTIDKVAELATTGADFMSVGALTHSAPAVDISFEIQPLEGGV
jgi:nicotinate-nucleotide pyrophosphorylase (carboxylating)